MRIEGERASLIALLQRQIGNIFSLTDDEQRLLSDVVPSALDRTEYCFSRLKNKYYRRQGEVYFNPFHSSQYAIFLYFISNSIFRQYGREHSILSDKVYYLNKCLNGLDLYYEVEMPRVFFLDHPVGTIIGRAKYGERFSFCQNCTVGNNKGIYPTFGENVRMMSGSQVLGQCVIGDDVIISANAYVKDADVPSCSIVFGQMPNIVIDRRDPAYFRQNSDCISDP